MFSSNERMRPDCVLSTAIASLRSRFSAALALRAALAAFVGGPSTCRRFFAADGAGFFAVDANESAAAPGPPPRVLADVAGAA